MTVFDFNRAIVRRPGRSVVNGLREDRSAVPDYAGVVREHEAYVAALRAAGLSVDVLDPLEEFSDSVFVEDPALVFTQGAILLRPGAPTRLGERDAMRQVLADRFAHVFELKDDEFADGGDVLVSPAGIYIGLSARTNLAGATALQAHLGSLGLGARIVQTPKGVLHFKTAVSHLSDDTLFATDAMAASSVFEGVRLIRTPAGEEAAANALRINGTVFIGDHYPRTAELLAGLGFTICPLPVTEIAKLDAGLSCMSLRWWAA